MYIKKILLAIALIGVLVMGAIAYYIYNVMFASNTSFNEPERYIYVPTNGTYTQVQTQLKPLLKNVNTFNALAKQKKYTTYVKPGKFVIKKGMSNNDIVNSIRSKNIPVRVSFNNQHSLEKLAGRIASQIEPDSLQLLVAMQGDSLLSKAGFTKKTALGMYLPNSYEFFWNTAAAEFCERMCAEYQKFWNDTRKAKAKALNLTQEQVIVLASIVHEESKMKAELPRIAGVYLNRLKKGMLLQADPTIKYAAYQLPEYQNKIIKRVLNKHKEIESPYNTYKYTGLPPGPIAMPDIAAIDAVLNYEKHDYLYFVADAKNIGYHKFAKTLAQHNINAAEYHRLLNNQGIR